MNSFSLYEITSGFVEAVKDWGKRVSGEDPEGGGVAAHFFFRDCQMPKLPDRVPSQAELEGLEIVGNFIDGYREMHNGSSNLNTKMKKSIQNSESEFLSVNKNAVENASHYLEQQFEVQLVSIPPDYVPDPHPTYSQVQQDAAEMSEYFRPPPPGTTREEYFSAEQNPGSESNPDKNYDGINDPFGSGGEQIDPGSGEIGMEIE